MGYGVVWRMSVHALNTHRMTATRRDRVFVTLQPLGKANAASDTSYMTFWWVPAAAEASSIGFHTQPEADRVRDAAQSRSTRRLRVDEGSAM